MNPKTFLPFLLFSSGALTLACSSVSFACRDQFAVIGQPPFTAFPTIAATIALLVGMLWLFRFPEPVRSTR